MAYVWQRWMADAYRAAGLTVVEVEGWENRGRPASTGSFDPATETVHHDGATSSPSDPMPVLKLLIEGRDDLPGPLSQKGTDHNGVVYVIAAGRANHAGRVGKSGVPGMPYGADGNALAMGNEVATNGTQALTPAQRHSIAVQAAVDLEHLGGRGAEYAHRHEDISATGKWDLGSLSTPQLRSDIAAADTTDQKEIDIMDEDTKAWLAARFTKLRQQNNAIIRGQGKIAAGTSNLLEIVADIEGLTADNKKRVGVAKTQILDAIDELRAEFDAAAASEDAEA